MVQKVHKLESENFELNKQVEKIISGIEDQRRKHVKEVQYSRYLAHSFKHLYCQQLGDKDDKIQKTLKEIQKQMEEYQNLMQVKTALDMEIAVYKQLLETEEDRLGIKPENGLGRRNILWREVLKDIHVFCLKYV